MDNFLDFISSRYSVRSYDGSREIEEDKLLRVLEAGRMAPSAANLQPGKIVVAQSADMLDKLHRAYPAPWFAEANTVLIVKGNASEAWMRKPDGYNSICDDLSILMTHLILAAHAEGLATCWVEAFDTELMGEILKLKEDEVVYAMTPIGYAPQSGMVTRPKTRKPLDEIVEWL